MYTTAKVKIAASKHVFAMVQKPTPVCYIGPGKTAKAAEILKVNRVKKVLVITDKTLIQLGILNPMFEAIKNEGIETFIYDGVKPDPTFTIVEEALEMCLKNDCEAVIAFGGGSVIDTSKVVAVSVTNGRNPKKLEGLLKVKKKGLPFIAVPTTAGTGSEVTLAAVISDPITHKKTTVIDPKLVPTWAILDPNVTLGLPPHITAATTMDALTHALEAYTNTYATEETDRYATMAIKLIYDNLIHVYKNPTDVVARENILLGSFYAGMAFTRAYVGYVHAFSHNIGAKFGVPHGLANAVLLPHVMESYISICERRFADLSDVLNISRKGLSKKEKARAFVDSIFELNSKINIPERLEKFDRNVLVEIREAGFKECHGNYPVPYYYTTKEADKILSKVCQAKDKLSTC